MESEMEMKMKNEPRESSAAASVTLSRETEDKVESKEKIEDSLCVNCCQAVSAKSGSSTVDLTLDCVKISSSLSTIYKLHYLAAFEDSLLMTTTTTTTSSSEPDHGPGLWNWSADAKLCEECSIVFSSLWDLYENFNQLRNLESCLAKEIQKLDNCIQTQEIMRRIKEEPEMEEDEEEDQAHHNFNDFSGGASTSVGRKTKNKNLEHTNDYSDDDYDDDNDPLANNSCDDDDLDGYEEVSNGSKSDNVTNSGPWIVLQKLENDPVAQNSRANHATKSKASVNKRKSQQTRRSPRKTRKVEFSDWEEETNDQDYSEESDDGSHGDSESDYNSDGSSKAVAKKKRKAPLTRSTKKPKNDRKTINDDPKVGDEIYEYAGKWRYERKKDEHGKFRVHCLTCEYSTRYRYKIVTHIDRNHNPELSKRCKMVKLDEDNFLYHDTYRIEKVTEPTGVRYKCGTCGALTNYFGSAKNHIKRTHIDGKIYACEHCGHKCSSIWNLNSHLESFKKRGICIRYKKNDENDPVPQNSTDTLPGKSVANPESSNSQDPVDSSPEGEQEAEEEYGSYSSASEDDDENDAKKKVKAPTNVKVVLVKSTSRLQYDIRKDPKVGENIYEYDGKWRYERKRDEDGLYRLYCLSCDHIAMQRCSLIYHIKHKHIKAPKVKKPKPVKVPYEPDLPPDPVVGDKIYEYEGKWRYERKRNEQGKYRCRCLVPDCRFIGEHRSKIVKHFKNVHEKVIEPESLHATSKLRATKIDDNNFMYDGKYRIERVTETNGIFYKCVTCGVLKKTYYFIKLHIRSVHIDSNNWICETCGKTYPTRGSLRTHMNRHSGVKLYVCEECGKMCKSSGALAGHKESHMGKIFVCECGNKFTYKRSLDLHRKMYSHFAPAPPPDPNVPFHVAKICASCKKEFATDIKYEQHVAVCRAKEKKPCGFCGKSYIWLNEHQLRTCKKRPGLNQSENEGGGNAEKEKTEQS